MDVLFGFREFQMRGFFDCLLSSVLYCVGGRGWRYLYSNM